MTVPVACGWVDVYTIYPNQIVLYGAETQQMLNSQIMADMRYGGCGVDNTTITYVLTPNNSEQVLDKKIFPLGTT